MKRKGFTLVELLVVIAILAILATVSIIGYSSFIGKANESNCLTEATQIRELFIAEDIGNDNMSFTATGEIKFTGTVGEGSDARQYGLQDVLANLEDDITLGSANLEVVNDLLKYTSKDGGYFAIIKFDNSEIKPKKVSSNSQG